jgi:hypothetical protein
MNKRTRAGRKFKTPASRLDPFIKQHRAKQRKLDASDSRNFVERNLSKFGAQADAHSPFAGLLDQTETIFLAKHHLRSRPFDRFCEQVGLVATSPEVAAMCKVGKRIAILRTRVEFHFLWAAVHAVTQLGDNDFNRFIESGESINTMSVRELRERVMEKIVRGQDAFPSLSWPVQP